MPQFDKPEIVFTMPPNFTDIAARFPYVGIDDSILYAFGDKIYNPQRVRMTPELMAHEMVHCERQLAYEGIVNASESVAAWWQRYLTDNAFMFDEELHAHRAEWLAAFNSMYHSKAKKKELLAAIANRLSGPLYNNQVDGVAAVRLIVNVGEQT